MNFFVGAFYDAVMHYGQALNETLDMGIDILNGRKVARQMWNRTFTGNVTYSNAPLRADADYIALLFACVGVG